MHFNLIVAGCESQSCLGIGYKNTIPWKIKTDMDHFRNVTSGHSVVMGRNTWESIPRKFRPLRNRMNYVITSNEEVKDSISDYIEVIKSPHFPLDGCDSGPAANYVKFVNSFEEALEAYNATNVEQPFRKLFVIGGEKLYKYVLDEYADNIEKIYLTVINKEYECDTFFPKPENLPGSIIYDTGVKAHDDISGEDVSITMKILSQK